MVPTILTNAPVARPVEKDSPEHDQRKCQVRSLHPEFERPSSKQPGGSEVPSDAWELSFQTSQPASHITGRRTG